MVLAVQLEVNAELCIGSGICRDHAALRKLVVGPGLSATAHACFPFKAFSFCYSVASISNLAVCAVAFAVNKGRGCYLQKQSPWRSCGRSGATNGAWFEE